MNVKRIIGVMVFLVVSLMISLTFAEDMPSYRNDDGSLDLGSASISDLSGGINGGEISIGEFLDANPTDFQLESVFLDVSVMKQTEIIKSKFGCDVAIDGKISSFKQGVITTSKESLNLNQYSDFTGGISINSDDSITITSLDKEEDIILDGIEIQLGKGSNVNIGKDKGVIIVKGSIMHEGVRIESSNEFKLFLDSEDHRGTKNYVQFDYLTKNINMDANDILFDLNGILHYDDINIISGENIRLVNGGMNLLYKNEKLLQESPLGLPKRNLVIHDFQNKDIFYMDSKEPALQEVIMSDFLQGRGATSVGKEIDVSGCHCCNTSVFN